jgi:hypothetical protein
VSAGSVRRAVRPEPPPVRCAAYRDLASEVERAIGWLELTAASHRETGQVCELGPEWAARAEACEWAARVLATALARAEEQP